MPNTLLGKPLSPEAGLERERLEGLTSLRGVAAILVVIVHVWAINPLPTSLGTKFINVFFPLGVTLFFVISAFSLCVSTIPRIGSDGWISAFSIRRLMRIAPLFYLMSAFYLLVVPAIVGGPNPWLFFFQTVSFLFNFMPGQHESLVWAGWTIGVEMLFYLILPFVLVFIGGLRSSAVFLILANIVSCGFIAHYRTPTYPLYYADLSFMGSIGIFAWGIFSYFAYRWLSKHPVKGAIALSIMGVSLLGAIFLISTDGMFFHLPVTRALLWGPVFAGVLLSECLRPSGALTNVVWSHLGKLSYSLYLCHPPVIYFLYPVFLGIYGAEPAPEIALVLCILLTMTILYPLVCLVHFVVEQPGIRLGEEIVRRRICNDNRREVHSNHSALSGWLGG